MRTIYKVNQAIEGAGRNEQMYFETETEAEKYYQDHKYTDRPEKVRKSTEEADELIKLTRQEIAYTRYING